MRRTKCKRAPSSMSCPAKERRRGGGSPVESLETRLYLTVAAYSWQNANIGAGGFVDGIYYDPNNQNTLYARTDIGGLYKSTNDGATWSELLDFVGNGGSANNYNGFSTNPQDIGVLSFAMDPQNSNYLYADVGEYNTTDGMILYSRNGGQTWNSYSLPFYVGGNSNGRGDGEQLQVDPNDENILFLGTNDDGLWYCTNATSTTGLSFSQVSSFSASVSTTFVLFDGATGSKGNPTPTIFVGVNSTSAGTNLYETTYGGTSWTQVTGSGSLPSGYLPGHGVISNGNLFLGYANDEAPEGSITDGGVYRYSVSSNAWTNISPLATSGAFGYDSVAVDPSNPKIVVVASFDYNSGPDQMWRTIDANDASPIWTEVYDYSTAQNYGYNGFDNTRNTTNAPWVAAYGDGVGNWVATIAINPFNSNQLMYGTGGGIYATNNISNGGANTQLTGANSWYFPDTGIEFTDLAGLAAPTSGVPLYSAMADIGGFAHSTLNYSPQQGSVYDNGSGNSTDYAGENPSDAVIVGEMGTTNGLYTTNDGASFDAFSTSPGGSADGTVAISANGSTIVWAPAGEGAYFSTNDGANWTLATLGAGGTLPTGGVIVSDKVNPNYFYYWTENSDDNSWTLYISSDGGQQFTLSTLGSIATGNVTLAASPYVAGQLWMGGWNGIYKIVLTNLSNGNGPTQNITQVANSAVNVYSNDLALGAPAPGTTTPAIYIYGTTPSSSFVGVWRSDDGGTSWLQLNSTNQQWGGLIQAVAADPNVFGRVYIGVNGRGILVGNPTTSLPANWIDTDINDPGNPGWATSSLALSTGAVVNEWSIVGGGAGYSASPISISSLSVTNDVATAISTVANGFQVGQLVTIAGASNSTFDGTFAITTLANSPASYSAGIPSATEFTFALSAPNSTATGTITATLDDQFNYAYQSVAGNDTLSAELTGLTNADGNGDLSQAGVMYRASTNADDPFIELAQNSVGNLVLEYRTTIGGSVTTRSVLSGISVGSEYVEIIRNSSNFTARYSSSGTSWTTAGTVTIAAIPTTANLGLASTASYNPQLADATFTNVAITAPQGFAVQSGSNLQINLSPAGPVTLSTSGSNITVSQNGVQDIFTGISAITVTDTGSGDILNVSGSTGLPFSFSNFASATLNISSATLTFAADPGASVTVGTLSLSNSATAIITPASTGSPTILALAALKINDTSVLDVTNNEVLINYGSGTDPIAAIFSSIARGYASGAWNGTGIISSVARTNPSYGLGYADSADAGNPANLPSGQIEILYTLLGDANLDGKINGADFTLMAGNFNDSVTNGWDKGDFNYDGKVNGNDFVLLSANFNQADQIAVPAVESASLTVASTTSTQAISIADASESNHVVGTVLGKHVAKKKPHH
jgi:xyloglucan-specific exo-beta-1,4-glucanase